ncbi:MAG: site-specific DNA-methyltransferase [Eubacteriales bacterium]|nr:site-specific DNA-methyltransferase [Eubacteriales bacterium]
MIWQRASCRYETASFSGSGGLLVQGSFFDVNLDSYLNSIQCIYLDPPAIGMEPAYFENTVGSGEGKSLKIKAYDNFNQQDIKNYKEFLYKTLRRSFDLLSEEGVLFFHLSANLSYHARIAADEVFGTDNFINEIIWNYKLSGKAKKYFGVRHDTILYYAKNKDKRYFNIERIPCGKKKENENHMKKLSDSKGRPYRYINSGGKKYIYYDDAPNYPDDVWSDIPYLNKRDREFYGYEGQKPKALLERIIRCSTKNGDYVLDPMCGSGSSLVAAAENNCQFIGIDNSKHAIAVSRKRLKNKRVRVLAPLSEESAMLDASVIAGVGFFDVSINFYSIAHDAREYDTNFEDDLLSPLDKVDQWYAGILKDDIFNVYAAAVRTKLKPDLERNLKVPILKGTVAILIVDIFGNRSLWVSTGQI